MIPVPVPASARALDTPVRRLVSLTSFTLSMCSRAFDVDVDVGANKH